MADCEIYIPSPNSCDECDVFEARLETVENTLPLKQDKLKAGTNITISSNNTISANCPDTWQVNTKLQEGYVTAGNGYVNKVWKTDASGMPGWRDDDNTTYTPASTTPLMDGTGAVGTSAKYAREDHVHPTDTTRNPVIEYTNVTTDTHINVATSTHTTVANTGTLSAGTYLFNAHVHFDSPHTGTCMIYLSQTADGSHASRYAIVTQPATTAEYTHMSLTLISGIAEGRTLYLRVWQNSGSTVEVGSIGIQIVKLK